MLPKRIQTFLDKHNIKYDTIACTPKQSTREIAKTAHISEKGLAKTTIIKLDGNRFAMIVEPLSIKTNLERWKQLLGSKQIELATDDELDDLFDEFDTSSIPALGNLFEMDVFLDDRLSLGDEIAFSGGTPSELIKLSYKEYARWVKPKLFHIH